MFKIRVVTTAFAALVGGLANGQQIESQALNNFVEHPSFCAVLVGGSDRAGDSADRAFAEALARTTAALGGPVDMALARINMECIKNSTALAAPDKPDPRAAL